MKKNLMTIIALMVFVMMNVASIAQETDKPCPGHEKGKMAGLELTADQQTKIEALHLSLQKELLPIKNQLKEKKAHLNTLMTAEKADMTAINTTIDEIGAFKVQIMKKEAAHKQEIRKLLTDEQRIKFDLKHQGEGRGMRGKGMHGKKGVPDGCKGGAQQEPGCSKHQE